MNTLIFKSEVLNRSGLQYHELDHKVLHDDLILARKLGEKIDDNAINLAADMQKMLHSIRSKGNFSYPKPSSIAKSWIVVDG